MTNKYRKPGQISPELLAQLKNNKPKKQEWHWSFTLTIIGIIGGGVLMLGIWSFTLISIVYLLLGALAIAALCFVLQWKFFYSQKFIQKNFRMPLAIYALYNISMSFVLAGLLLTVNWLGASSAEEIERHRIVGFDRDYILDSNAEAVFLLENDAYQDSPGMRSMPYLMAINKKKLPFLDIVSHKGLLGLSIFEEKRMSPDPDALLQELHTEEPVEETQPVADTTQVNDTTTTTE